MFLVVSYGGVGTTEFIFKLKHCGVKVNHEGDQDGLKHRPDPNLYTDIDVDRAIYIFDCPWLATKSHFNRGWYHDQVRKTTEGSTIIKSDYTWNDFVRDKIDWGNFTKHFENWTHAPFPTLFIKLSEAHRYNDVISYFVGLKQPVNFFQKKERNSKLLESERSDVFNELEKIQAEYSPYRISIPYQTTFPSGGMYMKTSDCILDPRITLEVSKFLDEDTQNVFVNGDIFENLMEFFHKKKNDWTLIYHNTDRSFTTHQLRALPSTCKKVLAVNNSTPGAESIPLGLKWNMTEKELNHLNNFRNLEKNINCYVNFNIPKFEPKFINYIKAREMCMNYFSKQEWAFIETGVSQENFYEHLAKSKYCVCPAGFGVDTRRFWECVYLDTIPIVLQSELDNFYKQWCPKVIIVRDWYEVYNYIKDDIVVK